MKKKEIDVQWLVKSTGCVCEYVGPAPGKKNTNVFKMQEGGYLEYERGEVEKIVPYCVRLRRINSTASVFYEAKDNGTFAPGELFMIAGGGPWIVDYVGPIDTSMAKIFVPGSVQKLVTERVDV